MRKYFWGLWAALILCLATIQWLEDVAAGVINETVLMFPCNAKAVSRIWVDDRIFWDSKEQGLILLEECDNMELHVGWSESIVVEWIATTTTGQYQVFRFRLLPNGTLSPEIGIPEVDELNL